MRRFVILLLALQLLAGGARAMDFRPVTWRGHEVLLAAGEIRLGDADRLSAALDGIAPLPHGVPVVLLDSAGGSVRAALEMSEMLDRRPVHMVIPEGARCASACASILFVAGAYRTVEAGGAFGQHSCSSGGLSDSECNDVISNHAVENGVSYGSIAAFITYTPPEDILWFSRESVDCWGISRYPYTDESGYVNFEPCFYQVLKDEFPRAQAAWRVDFFEDGYSAFLRPVADHIRELELKLYCDENRPGRLFLSMDIAGPSEAISRAITHASLMADPVVDRNMTVAVSQVDPLYSRATVEIPTAQVLPFLTRTDRLELTLFVRPLHENLRASTGLSGSRKALIFAANHCVNG